MLRSAQRKTFLLITVTVIMLACVPTLAPASTPIPTFDPNSIARSIEETMNAAAAQTQVFITPSATATFTPTSTKTPSITPSPTNTFIFIYSTPTKLATPTFSTSQPGQTDYACVMIAQTPEDNSLIGAGVFFSIRWQVKNTGLAVWDSNNMDYRYKSGTKMHSKPAYDLYKDISPGDVADIIVDMTAPTTPGTYAATWKLRAGKTEFCTMTVAIVIK